MKTFKCSRCKSTDFVRTGKVRKGNTYKNQPRHEYLCRNCGFRGYAVHPDVLRASEATDPRRGFVVSDGQQELEFIELPGWRQPWHMDLIEQHLQRHFQAAFGAMPTISRLNLPEKTHES